MLSGKTVALVQVQGHCCCAFAIAHEVSRMDKRAMIVCDVVHSKVVQWIMLLRQRPAVRGQAARVTFGHV